MFRYGGRHVLPAPGPVVIAAAIVGAEVAFWVVLGLALASRYLLRLTRTSAVLLVCVPLVDVVLLVLVAVDVARGAEPTTAHAIAASYLGFTVAFGHTLVRWADRRVAHHVDGTPLPARPARGSAAHVRSLWVEWGRAVAAAVTAVVVLAGLGLVSGAGAFPPDLDAAAGNPLWSQMVALALVVAIWLLAGPAFARRDRDGAGSRA